MRPLMGPSIRSVRYPRSLTHSVSLPIAPSGPNLQCQPEGPRLIQIPVFPPPLSHRGRRRQVRTATKCAAFRSDMQRPARNGMTPERKQPMPALIFILVTALFTVAIVCGVCYGVAIRDYGQQHELGHLDQSPCCAAAI